MQKYGRQKQNGTYSLAEVAEEIGVSPQKISQWLATETDKPRLPAGKGSRSRRFSAADVRRLERRRLFDDIRAIFGEPDVWLDTPNPRTAGDTPREAIESGSEQLVLDIVESIKHGMIS